MKYLLASLLIVISQSALALGVATFNYQRGSLSIERASPPPEPLLPWQEADAPRKKENARVSVTVDIRPITALYRQSGWINLGQLSQNEGVLFVLEQPDTARLGRMEYFQPVDALWIDENGVVTSIAPKLEVSELNEPMIDQKPSKGLLLLGADMAERLSIRPGDKVTDSEYFQAPPSVITLPR